MQLVRWRDGVRYVVEAYGPDREALEQRRKAWPGSRVEYDSMGLLVRDAQGRPRLSGPVYVLWRPAPVSEADAQPLPSAQTPAMSEAPTQRLPAGPQPATGRQMPRSAPSQPRGAAPPLSKGPAHPQPAPPAAPPGALPELEDPAEFLAAPAPAPQNRPAPGREPVAHKNITRVDRPARNAHGYHVRLGWRGAVYQKWFSDTTYGGRDTALAAALAWRDAKERELGKPRTERLVKGRDATSNTGIIGVARVAIKGRPYFRALWRDPGGRMRRRWFSIDDLGEQRALRAAIAAREEGTGLRLASTTPRADTSGASEADTQQTRQQPA